MSTPTPLTLEQRVKLLEAKMQTEATGLWAWVKDKWPHVVTWLTMAWALLGKHL